MARPPDGTTTAEESRTAVLATVAARANFKAPSEYEKFFEGNRFRLKYRSAARALKARRKPAGTGAPSAPDQREWVWDSFEVDAGKLGLQLQIAWLPRPAQPGRRKDQAQLLQALRTTPGVIAIHDCFDDTVLVFGASHDVASKRRFQDRLNELSPDVLWAEVRDTDSGQPGRGWLGVARAVAAAERRLEDRATESVGSAQAAI